jgi:hypothetical protein
MKPWIPNCDSVPLITLRHYQTERVNQIVEDMLRAYALQYGRSWDKSLSYAEFSYNNNYQESLKMTPFEMLYGRRCRTPLFWSEARERKCDRTTSEMRGLSPKIRPVDSQ